ncbi:hypothetical protein ACC724_15605 [Rhizobium ruizarguesonis]
MFRIDAVAKIVADFASARMQCVSFLLGQLVPVRAVQLLLGIELFAALMDFVVDFLLLVLPKLEIDSDAKSLGGDLLPRRQDTHIYGKARRHVDLRRGLGVDIEIHTDGGDLDVGRFVFVVCRHPRKELAGKNASAGRLAVD